MTQDQDSASAAREFLTKAQEEVTRGELTQASEKGWGAAAQMVKAIAQERGWEHNGHFLLYQAVHNLVDETGDTQLVTLFQVAGNLHSNFYENWLPADVVRSGLDDVNELVDKLEGLL